VDKIKEKKVIKTYYRPQTIEEATKLLAKTNLEIVPIGGGSFVARHQVNIDAVVDLQGLGLNRIESKKDYFLVGATTTLQDLVTNHALPENLRNAAKRDFSYNIRQRKTIAGVIVEKPESSILLLALCALGSKIILLPSNNELDINHWLQSKSIPDKGQFIGYIKIPQNIQFEYESVSKTKEDKPLIAIAISKGQKNAKNVLLSSKNVIAKPITEDENLKIAYSQLINPDFSAEYFIKTTNTLIQRINGKIK
jgi:CO/xanthine dehydrogenase FAD-binding subunit